MHSILEKFSLFSWEVIHGKALGRTIGFPTANITLKSSETKLRDATYGLSGLIDGKKYFGIWAYRKSLDLFEAHFFDFSRDIYGEIISITPLFLIRENRKFRSLDELKDQIEKDREVMREWMQNA